MALQTVPAVIIDGWVNGPLPSWLPIFDTIGTTVAIYRTLVDILAPLVTIGLAVGLGYYGGRPDELRADYRRFCGRVAGGSTVGVGIVWGLLLVVGAPLSVDVWTVILGIGGFIKILVSVALPITVGAVAGAAVATFRNNGGQRRESTTDHPTSSPEPTNH